MTRRPSTALTIANTIVLLLIAVSAVVTAHTVYQLQHWVKRAPYKFDPGELAGFTDRYSYRSGEKISLYVHNTREAEAHLIHYGTAVNDTGRSVRIEETLQSSHYDQIDGFSWHRNGEIDTTGLIPGFYGLHLIRNGQESADFIIPIIIKPNNPTPIAVILSTNTWEAYNEYGGISNYSNNHFSWLTRRILKAHKEFAGTGAFYQTYLPRRRPNSLVSDDLLGQVSYEDAYHSKIARNEWTIIGFLEEHGFDYGVYGDKDFAFDAKVLDSRILVFPGHSEYWSAEMFNAFDRYIDRGGKVLMASGKPMAELVEEQENGSLVLAIETPVESIARRAGTVFTTTGAYTAAPFRAIRPQTWVFKGTELRRGSLFGASSANYPIAASFNRGPISGDGASGLFTAKIAPGSSKFVRLARGENPTGAADMVYRDTDSGGWIFNASSETFLGSAPRDPAVTQILLNLLNNAAEPHHGQ